MDMHAIETTTATLLSHIYTMIRKILVSFLAMQLVRSIVRLFSAKLTLQVTYSHKHILTLRLKTSSGCFMVFLTAHFYKKYSFDYNHNDITTIISPNFTKVFHHLDCKRATLIEVKI